MIPFLKPLTPEEYRAKHPRCEYCVYAKPGPYCLDWKCAITGKDKLPSFPRPFCRGYKPKPFTE